MQDQSAKFLAIYNKLFDISDLDSLADYVVNDSYKIIPYQLGIIYEYEFQQSNSLNILGISGTLHQNIHNSFSAWLRELINHLLNKNTNTTNTTSTTETSTAHKVVEIIDSRDLDIQNWPEHLGRELALVRLYNKDNYHVELLLINTEKYIDDEIIRLNLLAKAYNQSLKVVLHDKNHSKKSWNKSLILKYALGIAACSMIIPVTPTAMAPAEVISERTWSINAPVAGRISKVVVDPNSHVQTNQVLFEFDQLDLSNSLKIKQQELNILQTDYNQARALGFDDREQRGKTFRINQDITAKQQEVQYAQEQLNLSLVKAPAEGTVLFKSKNDLLGKPTNVGETIMRLANVNSMEIEAWLDVNDSINLGSKTKLYYYSNKAPFSAIPLKLSYYSYEAYITPTKKIAYRLLAKLDTKNNDLIIGDHGQVKIYGDGKKILAMFLFQKPISTLRQWFYRVV